MSPQKQLFRVSSLFVLRLEPLAVEFGGGRERDTGKGRGLR